MSDDEAEFLANSKEYQVANQKYQTEFSQFLISKFAAEYSQVGNNKTLEELLFIIRKEKDRYKQKFAADINEIRDQNKNLVDKNNALAESNDNLQKQLDEIKQKLAKQVGL